SPLLEEGKHWAIRNMLLPNDLKKERKEKGRAVGLDQECNNGGGGGVYQGIQFCSKLVHGVYWAAISGCTLRLAVSVTRAMMEGTCTDGISGGTHKEGAHTSTLFH
ncbi:unnamed protein product, partial [Sphenostylis stenocarpa]